MESLSKSLSFGCRIERYKFASSELRCSTTFTVILPPGASAEARVPALYFLSGLTCTDENFVIKAGVFRYVSENGIAVVCPDTSPRGLGYAVRSVGSRSPS